MKPEISFSLWSDDERRCITLNGNPTGHTVARESVYAICQWLETAWPDIERHFLRDMNDMNAIQSARTIDAEFAADRRGAPLKAAKAALLNFLAAERAEMKLQLSRGQSVAAELGQAAEHARNLLAELASLEAHERPVDGGGPLMGLTK